MSLWIKICGNTSLEDALVAAGTGDPADRSSSAGREAGANAVGFVFAPSPRRVTAEQVAAIVPHLPAEIEKVGVFVDASFDEIASTVEVCSLTGVQLHWDAPRELPAQLRARFGHKLRILRVVHFDAQELAGQTGPGTGHDFSRAESAAELMGALAPEGLFFDPNIDAILLDSRTTAAAGGTGTRFDWALASTTLLQSANARERRLCAAGGLTPGNVVEAIRILRPWGVDVVSGVESAPGRKDPAKVRAFIANARAATDLTSSLK